MCLSFHPSFSSCLGRDILITFGCKFLKMYLQTILYSFIRIQGLFRKYPAVQYERDIYWRRCKIQETLCIRQWCLSPLQSRHLTQFSQSPSAALSYFPESHWWSEISSLSKVILVLGEARSHRASNLGCRRGWVTWVIWCFAKNSAQDMMHEWVLCRDEADSHQLPVSLYCVSQLMKNIEVLLLINFLPWRGIPMMDNTFWIKKHS